MIWSSSATNGGQDNLVFTEENMEKTEYLIRSLPNTIIYVIDGVLPTHCQYKYTRDTCNLFPNLNF